MKKTILFSLDFLDLDSAKQVVESALEIALSAHESYYYGGEYYRGIFSGTSLTLQENFVEDDGEPTEPRFPLAKLLLYLEGIEGDVDNVTSVLRSKECVGKALRSSTY